MQASDSDLVPEGDDSPALDAPGLEVPDAPDVPDLDTPDLSDLPPPVDLDEPDPGAPRSASGELLPESDDERMARKRRDEQERLERIREDQQYQEDESGRQRRQNVRVDVQLPITLRLGGREAPARTRDVSATGIGFSTRLPVELEQHGEVTVEFEGWRFTKAFVIRFIKPILAGHQVGVQFEELSQEEREKLVKQVFDMQRAQLQHKQQR